MKWHEDTCPPAHGVSAEASVITSTPLYIEVLTEGPT